MRAKFKCHGEKVFETHELLEMLLYHIIPYKDTNPVAWRLLKAFCTLDGIAAATKEELASLDGVGERCAEFLHSVFSVCRDMEDKDLLFSGEQIMTKTSAGEFFVNYFSTAAKKDGESYRVAAATIDSEGRLLSVIEPYKLDFGSGAVRSIPFINAAIAAHATGIIIAHNHPYGPARETVSDRASHEVVKRELEEVGIALLDHYVICGESYVNIMDNAANLKLNQKDIYRMAKDGCISLGDAEGFASEKLEALQKISALAMKAPASDSAADALFLHFVRLCDVFNADMYILKDLLGSEMAAFFFKLFFAIYLRRRTARFSFGKAHTKREVGEYFMSMLGYEPYEKVYILLFDSKGRPISCEFVTDGTVDTTNLPPRRLIEIVKRNEASAAAIAHNHPSSGAEPSADDLRSTESIKTLFQSLGIEFFGHYVVSCDDFCVIYDRKTIDYKSDFE